MLGSPEGIEHLGGIDVDAACSPTYCSASTRRTRSSTPTTPRPWRRSPACAIDCTAGQGGAVARQRDPRAGAAADRADRGAGHPGRAGGDDPAHPGRDGDGARAGDAVGGPRRPDVDHVLLVGGSSRIPLVAELVSSGLGPPGRGRRPPQARRSPSAPPSSPPAPQAPRPGRRARPRPGCRGSTRRPPAPPPPGPLRPAPAPRRQPPPAPPRPPSPRAPQRPARPPAQRAPGPPPPGPAGRPGLPGARRSRPRPGPPATPPTRSRRRPRTATPRRPPDRATAPAAPPPPGAGSSAPPPRPRPPVPGARPQAGVTPPRRPGPPTAPTLPAAGMPPPPGPSGDLPPGYLTGDAKEKRQRSDRRRNRLSIALGVLVLLVALLATFALTANGDEKTTVADIEAGECFNGDDFNDIDAVDCAEQHQTELFEVAAAPDPQAAFPADTVQTDGGRGVQHRARRVLRGDERRRRPERPRRQADRPDRGAVERRDDRHLLPRAGHRRQRPAGVDGGQGRRLTPISRRRPRPPSYELGVDQLELAGGLGQRHPHDVAGPQRHHLPEGAVVHGVDGGDAEAGRQHPVERGRASRPAGRGRAR